MTKNEKHEKAVVDFSESGFRFCDEFFFCGLDFVSIHIICLLRWEWVTLSVIVGVIRLGVVELALVSSNAHEKCSGADGGDAHIKASTEAEQENKNNQNLNSRPQGPTSSINDGVLAFLGGGSASVESMLLSKHLWGAVSSKHNTEVFAESGRSREQLGCVVDKHHG